MRQNSPTLAPKLPLGNKEHPMQRFYNFQSLQDARLQVGGGYADGGWEGPDSRLAITVMTRLRGTEDCQDRDEEVEVQIWLTIPQLAAIVVAFFNPIIPLGRIYRGFLRRLLEKRWAHMTWYAYKYPPPDCQLETMERYANRITS